MRIPQAVPVAVLGALLIAGGCSTDSPMRSSMVETPSSQVQFQNAMRKLWEDHITWTRLFIVSDVSNLPDLGPTTQRLLQNQSDIGEAVKPFYGDAAGDELTALLRGHILGAAALLEAAKSGNQTALTSASGAWYANADSIAGFLSAANPDNWELSHMKAMMKEHLDLTLGEAVDRLHGDYASEIAAYDEIHEQILGMADMLSNGIIAQFPSKFQ
jgi:hypothetical protein